MKSKYIILYLLGLINITFVNQALSQTELGWAKQFGGPNYDYATRIFYSVDGYLYLSCIFQDSIDADPGPGISMLYSGQNVNSYIAKIDTAGIFIWAKQLKSKDGNEINDIVFDRQNNILATGTFQDSIDFDPGNGTYFLSPEDEEGGFIWKIDSDGNFLFAKKYEGSGLCQPVEIEIDKSGCILTTGTFNNTIDFDPGTGIFLLSTQEYTNNAFFCKLDSLGEFVWAKQILNNSMNATDYGNAIAVDNQNNIYLEGNVHGVADFDPGPGTYYLQADYYGDAFISKYTSDGDLLFARKIGADGFSSYASQITILKDSTLLLSGQFEGLCYFDSTGIFSLDSPNASSIYLCRMTREGNPVDVRALYGEPWEILFNETLNQDINGNIYLAGSFGGDVDFDLGLNEFIVTAVGNQSIFISKYDSIFNLQWVNTIDCEGSYVISCISDNDGHLYSAGSFNNTVDFDPGSGVFNMTSNGNWDGFILKLNDNIYTNTHYISIDNLEILPNPAIDFFTVQFQQVSQKSLLQFIDMSGRKVEEMSIAPFQTIQAINCSHWPPGIYFGQLINDCVVVGKCKVVVK
jgi:hypothetical protein